MFGAPGSSRVQSSHVQRQQPKCSRDQPARKSSQQLELEQKVGSQPSSVPAAIPFHSPIPHPITRGLPDSLFLASRYKYSAI